MGGRIIAGIGCSHAPAMAGVYDAGRTDAPDWAPLFDAFARTKAWLRALKPDLAIVCYNDHLNHFFFDAYPTFALGIAPEYPLVEEGKPRRALPPLPGDTAFGWHVAESLVAQEFDPTICQDLPLDHGAMAPLPLLFDHPWEVPVLPRAGNVVRTPLPTPARCFRLGRALRNAVESWPEPRRVAILGTGGLSHQIHGPDFGFVNPEFDTAFLDGMEGDPAPLAALSIDDYFAGGGAEGAEMIMWLVMRGALSDKVLRRERHYATPALTGLALIALEDQA